MDHQSIEERSVAEAYVLARLAPAEEASFEEHLLTCGECRERVRWAEELHGSLRAMAAEDHGRAAGLGLLAWLARRGRAARLGLTAVLLLAVALPVGLLVDEARLRQRLADASAAVAHGQRRAPAPAAEASPGAGPGSAGRQAGWTAERERLAAELRQRDVQLRQLNAELGKERRQGEDLRTRLAELSRPQVNTAIFSLGLVRGEAGTNRVLLGPRPSWIVLSIELPAPSDAVQAGTTYRAALVDGRGRTVWSGEGLRPTANDTLALGLFSSLLAPGEYRLVLQGAGETPQRSEIPFRVARQR